jgi:hypothetical protein
MLLDRGVQGNDRVPPLVFAAGKADVAHNADQTPAGDQGVETPLPDLVQLREELRVVGHKAQLPLGLAILLERPIGGAR